MFRTLFQHSARAAATFAAAAMVAAFAQGAARASSLCADRKVIVERLADAGAAPRRAYAALASAGLVEVFTSERGGWAILVTSPDGLSCVVAAGEAGGPELAASLPREGA